MKLTPAMQQYASAKEQYPDAIILFRMGDFYECFYEDAKLVSQILGITLTARGKDETRAPLAGIPYHALDKYLKQLVDSGHKIAICEQLEDPKFAKGVVKRGVTRVITPGTIVEDSILQDKSNNYIAALFADGASFGFACCDISTGEFITCEFDKLDTVLTELSRFSPSEIVISPNFASQKIDDFSKSHRVFLAKVSDYFFFYTKAADTIKKHFGISDLSGLGFANQELAVCATGALFTYLKDSSKIDITYIKTIQQHNPSDYLILDAQTIRNLELIKNIRDASKNGTLLQVIDKTVTSAGGRLLKQWLLHPLCDIQHIRARLAAVDNLMNEQSTTNELRAHFEHLCDMERLISRITFGLANPRDLVTLKQTLQLLPVIREVAAVLQAPLLTKNTQFADLSELATLIDKAIKDEPPLSVREGHFIKRSYNHELDEFHSLSTNAKDVLAKIEADETAKTGIPTLKVKYNRVFGYYLEVTNKYKDRIPANYTRKQSTVNGERFVTPELSELEGKILGAQEKIYDIEYKLFVELCEQIKQQTAILQDVAHKISTLDVLCAFTIASSQNRYTMPTMSDEFALAIFDGRHPVIEQTHRDFIPNDCVLTNSERMMIITGPNMAGKSTYMRQVALITLLAHIGCFVPAREATIPIVDRLFSRVGALDDISKGQSTFMVEMTETANILHNATRKSMIILDEIGAGTSTYDGVSIAWAVGLDLVRRVRAKTMFSTHYHVLTKLEEEAGVFNVHSAVLEADDHITFLRKIVRGGTDKSYGIHVAKIAGVPLAIIEEARKIQLKLEADDELHDKIVVEKRPVPRSSIDGETASNDLIAFAKLKQKTLFEDQ